MIHTQIAVPLFIHDIDGSIINVNCISAITKRVDEKDNSIDYRVYIIGSNTEFNWFNITKETYDKLLKVVEVI